MSVSGFFWLITSEMFQVMYLFWYQLVGEAMKNVFNHKKNQSCNSWDFQGNEKNVISISIAPGVET